jgi:iron-sulfur cluster assembly protein
LLGDKFNGLGHIPLHFMPLCRFIFRGTLIVHTINIFFIFVKITIMQTEVQTPVTLTNGAIAELKRLMAAPDFDSTQVLRVGVKGGGCSGMTYVLGFDAAMAGDETFEIDGISCVMNAAHCIYLMGMEVDFQDGLNSRGFTFKNPNATKTCGCGTSFAA